MGHKQFLLHVAVALTLNTVVFALGGLWWWALLGMSQPVRSAVISTSFLGACAATVAWSLWKDTDARA